jgi:hypothetical protein
MHKFKQGKCPAWDKFPGQFLPDFYLYIPLVLPGLIKLSRRIYGQPIKNSGTKSQWYLDTKHVK